MCLNRKEVSIKIKASPALCEEIANISINLVNNEKVNAALAGVYSNTINLKEIRELASQVKVEGASAEQIEADTALLSILNNIAADKASLKALMSIYMRRFDRCTKDFFEKNPYYQKIKFSNHKAGNFELCHDKYFPGELMVMNEAITFGPAPYTYARCGYATEEIEFPVLRENGDTWMSITPNEINTMQKPIKKAKGKVVSLGCGLGYFAYMTHIKPEVSRVTIVEKDPNVIYMFKKFILPQFNYPEKIEVIQMDALKWMDTVMDGAYDYIFCDIWQNATDGVYAYVKLKSQQKKFKTTKVSYWVEHSLIHAIKFAFIIPEHEFALMTFRNKEFGMPNDNAEKIYSQQTAAYSHNIAHYDEVKRIFDNEKISSIKDLQRILSTNYIKKLLKEATI